VYLRDLEGAPNICQKMTGISSEAKPQAASLAVLPDPNSRRGYLLVLGATMCWSTSGTFIRIISTNYAFTAWTLAFWRDLFTFACFLVLAVATGAQALRVARRDLIPLAAMGAISIGIFHVLWAQAVVMVPIAVATVLNYTAPFFVVLFAWLLWHERPSRAQTAALLLAFAGCLLVTGAYDLRNSSLNWPGLLVALSTGVTYGTLTIFGKDAVKRYVPFTIMTYAFGFGALTVLILQPAAIVESVGLPAGAWMSMAVLSIVSTVSGFALYTNGLKYLSAGSASITATLEPVIATGLAFVLLGEMIGVIQLLGGALVVGAVILLARGASAER
jgi:drug/metabolite transporter (DMT)-like permease